MRCPPWGTISRAASSIQAESIKKEAVPDETNKKEAVPDETNADLVSGDAAGAGPLRLRGFSFWGDDSVALTDLLLYLDYSGDVCRCMPEYRVDTEFGTGYGINLTEGYARCGDGQASLTAEQAEQIQAILDRQTAQGAN